MPFWLYALCLTAAIGGMLSPVWMPLMPNWFFGL